MTEHDCREPGRRLRNYRVVDGESRAGDGATSGIGAAAAETLAECGTHVLVASRGRGRGGAVVEAIRQHGGTADFVVADLLDADSVRRRGPLTFPAASTGTSRQQPKGHSPRSVTRNAPAIFAGAPSRPPSTSPRRFPSIQPFGPSPMPCRERPMRFATRAARPSRSTSAAPHRHS
ncbi:SDR family NAD(P)-dependent oxidoreductase [Streptomyces mirabilis]|uniref:SDR family NAD(P)-dependent oxidoreductase n=1 Tax=Streptomyces mirabilis TaxID=68239 RepID=UPI0036C81049